MKKLLLLLFTFFVGVWFALFSFKGLAVQGEYDSIIIDFREDISSTQLNKSLNKIASILEDSPSLNSAFSSSDNVYIIRGTKKDLKKLKKTSLIEQFESIGPNYIYNTLEIPNDPSYSEQWNLRRINIEQAWEYSQGDGVIVAVIDTGVSQVPDFGETEFVEGYDFVNDQVVADDDVGHGTHVAGTIAQSTNNNYGVAGVAYKAKIMPIKVLGLNGGTVADIAEGIKFAADNNADVINLSLGGGGDSELLSEAIKYAHEKGVVIVGAAGNENNDSASFPARYPEVISVSATDSAGKRAPYSNFGAGVDISAPGGSSEGGLVVQEILGGEEQLPALVGLQGTSMASPHVAGVAALIKASGISEPEQVREILLQSARKVENDTLNQYGAGELDAAQAVQLASKGSINFKDFWRWLRENGYLNMRFWIDGGTIALLPKLGMVLGSYLLALLLRNYLVFNLSLATGLVFGSSGLFLLQSLYIFDLPQWPLRLMGSSIPELGNVVMATESLNPIFASALIPFVLIVLFLQHPQFKWVALGSSLGVASCLTITAFTNPLVWGFGLGLPSQIFLLVNAAICFALTALAGKAAVQEV